MEGPDDRHHHPDPTVLELDPCQVAPRVFGGDHPDGCPFTWPGNDLLSSAPMLLWLPRSDQQPDDSRQQQQGLHRHLLVGKIPTLHTPPPVARQAILRRYRPSRSSGGPCPTRESAAVVRT